MRKSLLLLAIPVLAACQSGTKVTVIVPSPTTTITTTTLAATTTTVKAVPTTVTEAATTTAAVTPTTIKRAVVAPTPTDPHVTQAAVTYANCAAVVSAGKAPLHKGDPGYSAKLDRDGDGIACE